MAKHPEKDFGPIADDYAFFERHATEAENDARAYLTAIADAVPREGPIRMLDFGCGAGSFTARFLTMAGWPADRLQLKLVEPVESARREAAGTLARFSVSPIVDAPSLAPNEIANCFDVVIANHVLYYVPDLRQQLAQLSELLSPTGLFVTAIAGRANALIEFWTTAFKLLGREVPHYTSEDVAVALQSLGVHCENREVPYELSFPDTEENRLHIIRFLLADYLPQLPLQPLLEQFDRYQRAGKIEIHTSSDHYTIRKNAMD